MDLIVSEGRKRSKKIIKCWLVTRAMKENKVW